MAINISPVSPLSSSSSFHGTSAGPMGQDESLLFLKSRPPDGPSGTLRNPHQDTVVSDRFYVKDLSQRWSDRSNKSQGVNPTAASNFKPKIVKQPPLVADANNLCLTSGVLEMQDGGMGTNPPFSHGRSDLSYPISMARQSIIHQKTISTGRVAYNGFAIVDSLSVEETLTFLKHAEDMPTVDALISILQKCRKTKHLGLANYMLVYMNGIGLECVEDLGNSLVATLLECKSTALAHQVFRRLNTRTEFSWTYLIREQIECGRLEHAISLFKQMKEDCIAASKFTFVALLKACGRLKCVKKGQAIYLEIVKVGLEPDYYIGNTILDLYAKIGSFAEAWDVFQRLSVRDAVSWTSLISGYLDKGLCKDALVCFEQMRKEDIPLDAFTYACTLKACGTIGARDKGQEIHTCLVTEEFEGDSFVGNALVAMYAKCGLLEEAQDVFDYLSVQDVVSWTALIAGSADHGDNEVAVILYYQMHEQGLLPNDMTFASILKACTSTSDEETGKRLHVQIQAVSHLESLDLITATALIDMYARCGSMADAQEVFDAMPKKDLVGWNALMTGYTRQGESKLVFQLFDRMKEEGVQPDQITYLSVLTACSHAGLVDKGRFYFDALGEECGIAATIKHYNCMVDLLGRAGELKEALTMLQNMPSPPDLVAWGTLLAACRRWGNVEIGRQAFEATLRLDEKHDAAFNSMFYIYADANMWEEAKKIEAMREAIRAGMEHTKSWIDTDGSMHTFVVGDAPQYGKLEAVHDRVEEERLVQGFESM